MAAAKKKSSSKDSNKKSKGTKDEVKKKKSVTPEKTSKKSKAKPAKKRAVTNAFADLKPMKKSLNKTDLVQRLADKADTEPKIIKRVLNELETLVFRSLMKKGAGFFMWPGILKITAKQIPKKKITAIKKGTMVKNPFKGGIEEPHKGRAAGWKPATVKVVVRGMTKLKKAALA